jgi:hypothetical protein
MTVERGDASFLVGRVCATARIPGAPGRARIENIGNRRTGRCHSVHVAAPETRRGACAMDEEAGRARIYEHRIRSGTCSRRPHANLVRIQYSLGPGARADRRLGPSHHVRHRVRASGGGDAPNDGHRDRDGGDLHDHRCRGRDASPANASFGHLADGELRRGHVFLVFF